MRNIMKRLIPTLAITLAIAVPASAQYAGSGYPPAGGGGSSSFPITAVSGLTTATLTGDPSAQTGSYTLSNATEGAGWNSALGGTLGAGLFAFNSTKDAGVNVDISGFTNRVTVSSNEGASAASFIVQATPFDEKVRYSVTDGTSTNSMTATAYQRDLAVGVFGATITTITHAQSSYGVIANGVTGVASQWGGLAGLAGGDTYSEVVARRESNDDTLYRQRLKSTSGAGTVNTTATTISNVATWTTSVGNGLQLIYSILSINGIQDKTDGTKPACSSTTRRNRWFTEGGAGVADTYEACMKSAADTYAWVVIATNP